MLSLHIPSLNVPAPDRPRAPPRPHNDTRAARALARSGLGRGAGPPREWGRKWQCRELPAPGWPVPRGPPREWGRKS